MKRIVLEINIREGRIIFGTGFVPFDGCPIALTRDLMADTSAPYGLRVSDDGPWRLTHVATGKRLGSASFKKRADAARFLDRLKPQDPAWNLGRDATTEQRKACFDLYCEAAKG